MKPTTTRRQAIALTAAAFTLPVALPVAIAGPVDPELVDLAREIKAAHARFNAFDGLERAEREFIALSPPKPERVEMPPEIHREFENITFGEFKLLHAVAPDHPYVRWQREHGAEYDRRWTEYQQARERLSRECGVDAAEEKQLAMLNELNDLGERFFAIRAATLAGVALKLDMGELLEVDELAFASIAEDIRALVPERVS